MYPFVILLLTALSLVFIIKWILLKIEVTNMARMIGRIHGKQTNERVIVSTQDRQIIKLANAVNVILQDVYDEHGEHTRAIKDIRQSMANISHDLRTPLTSVLGYVKLLQNGSNTEEQTRHYLSVVYSKAIFLQTMIGNLFEFTRLEAGAYHFEMTRVDVNDILSEELAACYEDFTTLGMQPVVSLHNTPLPMLGDKAVLSRIISNLLQNMIKHGDGEPMVCSSLDNDLITLTFSNRAQALSSADVAHLFERFFIADRMRTNDNTGLGLSIAKEFTRQMGGQISAALQNDILTFTVTWKLSN